jgi:predicted Fe-Mo cluster-binding NifX family protein
MSTLKIAAVTNDGSTITSHFGMAEYYRVITIEDGKATAEEQRPKPHHAVHPEHKEGGRHEHQHMYAPISDCEVLLCGGMGTPAYENAEALGLKVIMTSGKISDAVQGYLAGSLVSDPRRIHNH